MVVCSLFEREFDLFAGSYGLVDVFGDANERSHLFHGCVGSATSARLDVTNSNTAARAPANEAGRMKSGAGKPILEVAYRYVLEYDCAGAHFHSTRALYDGITIRRVKKLYVRAILHVDSRMRRQ